MSQWLIWFLIWRVCRWQIWKAHLAVNRLVIYRFFASQRLPACLAYKICGLSYPAVASSLSSYCSTEHPQPWLQPLQEDYSLDVGTKNSLLSQFGCEGLCRSGPWRTLLLGRARRVAEFKISYRMFRNEMLCEWRWGPCFNTTSRKILFLPVYWPWNVGHHQNHKCQ